MPATFDGDNLIITLPGTAGAGVITLDAEADLYSSWKDWMLASPLNRKYPAAFRTVGGDALSASVDAGAYFFLQNDYGWRIKPAEEDHTINLLGNLAPEDSTLPTVVPTDGGYTVLVAGLQPVTQNVDSIIDAQTELVEGLQFRVESLRERGAGYGEDYYVDATNGLDSNTGMDKNNPVQTIQHAHDNLITSGDHDIINVLGAAQVIDEQLNLTKSNFSIRFPGREVALSPTLNTTHTLQISGDEVAIENLTVRTSDGSSYYSISISGDECTLQNCEVRGQDKGVYITSSFGSLFTECAFHGISNGSAVTIDDNTSHLDLINCHICTNTGSGVDIIATTGIKAIAFKGYTCIQNNTQYGININSGDSIVVFPDCNMHNNTLGNINNVGGTNVVDNTTTTTSISEAVFGYTCETNYTYQELVVLLCSALVGKLSGAGTGTISIRDINDTMDRIIASVDANGNRTNVTIDVS